MLKQYIKTLSQLRYNKISFEDFLFKESKDENGNWYDANSRKRFGILKALQFNWQKNDEALIRKLFETEIEVHRANPFQGIYPSLRLCAYLLAKFKNPENSLLFIKAKQANFDTHCGFDYEYLVSAGIEDTYEFMKSVNKEDSSAFYEYMGSSVKECGVSDEELESWFELLERTYPSHLIINGIEDEIALAIDLEEYDVVKYKVDKWKESIEEWTDTELNVLNYYADILHDYKTQIWINEKMLKKVGDIETRQTLFKTNADLYLKDNQPLKAWENLHSVIKRKNGNEYKFDRFFIEKVYEALLNLNNKPAIQHEIYKWAATEVQKLNNLHINLLEKIVRAAELMNDFHLKEKYTLELKKEKKHLEDILS